MSVLSNLEPKAVFTFFEELCAIPHGSGHTKAISDYLAAFGRARGLETHQDAANNVIIKAPGTPGYEQSAPVIVQGHMDMVCAKAPDCAKDMEREGLDLAVEGDTVLARGTSLGGDDGIAVAMALALLDAKDLPHPPIEAVFTVDEEIGLLGAAALDVSHLRGRRLINIDSEEEGVFTVGCAGGATARCVLPVTRTACAGHVMTVTVSGLRGGHSGSEIHKGRGNASILLGRILNRAGDIRLVSADGGMFDNAIMREVSATVITGDPDSLQALCAQMDADFRGELRATDPDVAVTCVPCREVPDLPMDGESTRRCVCLLTCVPNGVQVMSADMPGLVQTSLNLGILATGRNSMEVSFSVRSSVESQKNMLLDRLECLTAQLGGSVDVTGNYPGWEYAPESPLRELMVEVYREQYGREPEVGAIHAGLECGLFAGKIPGLRQRVLRPGSFGRTHLSRAAAHRLDPAHMEAPVRGSAADEVVDTKRIPPEIRWDFSFRGTCLRRVTFFHQRKKVAKERRKKPRFLETPYGAASPTPHTAYTPPTFQTVSGSGAEERTILHFDHVLP